MSESRAKAILNESSDLEYPRVHRSRFDANQTVSIGNVAFGGDRFVIIAGPCAVEGLEHTEAAARIVKDAGGAVLRGGAYKPRTSPYAFQGLGLEGIEHLRRASLKYEMPFVTEVMSVDAIEEMEPRVDAFQVGTRNMHNFDLLKALGETGKPVLLKRGFGATLREWMLAAEYVARGGNENIIFCERGVRTFSQETRFTLDLAGAIWAKQETFLPVIIDPSHATGLPRLIPGLTRAAAAAGLDGVMVEVHEAPETALSDGDQALTPTQLTTMISDLKPIIEAVGRTL